MSVFSNRFPTPFHIAQGSSRWLALALLPALIISWSSAFACTTNDIRYANSTNRIYIEQPVICTLSDLTAKAPASALELVDAGAAIWMLRSNIIIEEGGQLDLHETAIGGDVNELRMMSETGLSGVIYIRPNYGTLDINGPLITSWDETTGAPDTDISDGRSHIKARSYLDSNGVARESTVNVNNAEIAYLGYNASESYGLVLKVKAKRDEHHIFEQVDIYGQITNSYIHDNYMGFYSWGAYGVVIDNNEVANNISYAIDPHDNSDYLEITNNWVHDNGNHGIICSQHCDHLTITGNTVERNRHGIMLHRSVSDSIVENNISRDNADAGIALFESFDNIVRNNTVTGNRNGIRLSVGSHDNLIENNTVANNSKYSLYFYKGNDIPDVTDGRNRNNIFRNNTIHDTAEGFKLTDSDNNEFIDNDFTGNAPFKLYQGVDNSFSGNSIAAKIDLSTKGDATTHGSTLFEVDQDITVRINADADVTLRNNGGRVIAPEESNFPVSVGPTGTDINLNPNNIGSKSEVTVYPFWVNPLFGNITIRNPSWTSTKFWEATVSAPNLPSYYTVGGLASNETHTIKKDGIIIQELVSNQYGQIGFSDTLAQAGTTYSYLVEQGAAGDNPTTITLLPSDDSYVRGGTYAANNYGLTSDVQAKNKGIGNNYTREAFLKFDLSNYPVPSHAILRLAARVSSASTMTVYISSVNDSSWDETGITYSNKPAIGTQLNSFSLSNTSYQYYDIDVTSYIAAEKQAGRDSISFALTTLTSANAIIKVGSKEGSSDSHPELGITF